MRIEEHPIGIVCERNKEVEIYVNGKREIAREGDTVASALWAMGVRQFRRSRKRGEPRGPFCFIGRCSDCEVTINGRPRVKACLTRVQKGMRIEIPEESGG